MTAKEIAAEARAAKKLATLAQAASRRLATEAKREAARAKALAQKAKARAASERKAPKKRAAPKGKGVKIWRHDGTIWDLMGQAASIEAGRATIKRMRSTGEKRPIVLTPADRGAPLFPPPPSAL